MMKLSVVCDSLKGIVVYKRDDNILCVLKWGMDEKQHVGGFYVESAEQLVNIYNKDFYTLDDTALPGFIMNMATKIQLDQQMDSVEYFDSGGKSVSIPMFLPIDIDDDAIEGLVESQISVYGAWHAFHEEFNGNLYEEFIELLAQQELLAGFLDLVNVELSLLVKGNMNNE